MIFPRLLACLVAAASLANGQSFQSFLDRANSLPDSARTAVVDSFMNATTAFPFIEGDSLAHFIYRGNATSVTVPGDANNWDAAAFPMTKIGGTNFWYYTRAFESDARLDYKFVLNGSTWILDPRNPRQVTGGFGPNSELRMPGYVPAPEIEYYPGIPHGTLTDTTLASAVLGNSRTVRVYTPPGYSTSSDSLPLILVHDGLEYVTLAQMNNVLDYLIAHQRIKPLIAVFVPPVNRTPEYAGSQMDEFTSFILTEVLPFVEHRYRTLRMPAFRATLGASNGGNISLWLGLTHPEVFGNIAAQSSNVVAAVASGFADSARLNLKCYLDVGTYDIPMLIPLVRNLVSLLSSKGYPCLSREFHEGHSWGNWRAHVALALEYFFPFQSSGVRGGQPAPQGFRLDQNFPNPANPTTRIAFATPFESHVTLRLFDLLGREIRMLVDGDLPRGEHLIDVDASGLATGVYLYALSGRGFSAERKLTVIR